MLSFKELHELAGHATPVKLRDYKTALQLYKTIDFQIHSTDWINININAVSTSRQTKFITYKMNNYKVGINSRFSRSFTARGYLLGSPPGYKAYIFKIS